MEVFLTRHGETILNRKKIVQGWKDSPLTAKGRESAEKKARLLKSENIEAIFSSDLGRCVETARIINKKIKVGIFKVKELREQNFGKEIFVDLRKRVNLFMEKLTKNNFNKILLVVHDGTAKAILKKNNVLVDKIYKIKI